jgi:hypothetical protein
MAVFGPNCHFGQNGRFWSKWPFLVKMAVFGPKLSKSPKIPNPPPPATSPKIACLYLGISGGFSAKTF